MLGFRPFADDAWFRSLGHGVREFQCRREADSTADTAREPVLLNVPQWGPAIIYLPNLF